jgi:hypothetical protein
MSRAAPLSDKTVEFGFESEFVRLRVDSILPLRPFSLAVSRSKKFRQVIASIQEVGLVEPPVVARSAGDPGRFMLLDGQLRIEALRELGIAEVSCLVSTDDEAFTYNRRISRLSSVQEHKMIVRAVARGVPQDRIARALSIRPESVRRKVRMLDGISEEVVAILKDKQCPMAVFEILRKMKPSRQFEAAELLMNANNYSFAYASAILAGTPEAQLVDSSKPKLRKGITPEAMARIEGELARLQEGITSIQESYGQDHLKLTVIKGYVAKLLGNARVVRYLMKHRPDFMAEFQTIADMTSSLPGDAG